MDKTTLIRLREQKRCTCLTNKGKRCGNSAFVKLIFAKDLYNLVCEKHYKQWQAVWHEFPTVETILKSDFENGEFG